MTAKQRKRIILIGIGLVVLALIVYGFLPDPVPVELAQAQRGPMQVIVEEEGVTQVTDHYIISSPTPAFARRTDLEVGDMVEANQPVVHLEPPRAPIMDPRSRAEARARVEAAEAALEQAQQQVQASTAAAERATEERQRVERLFELGSATKQMVEQAVAEARQATANLDAATAAVGAARADLVAARTALQIDTAGTSNLPVQEVLRTPVGGRVLAVHHKSEGLVNAGEPLIEIGNTHTLEVHVDVLSQDAVRIAPGMRVLLDQWGGEATLEGRVERTEPQGFTQVSSLGVEEQRVTVVAALASPMNVWEGLGAGYRVLARFVVWEADDVLHVPTSALFRTDDGWALFVVEDGRAVRRAVEVGHQTGLTAQILSGLEAGEAVIAHPENSLEEGTRVEPRGD